MGDLEQYEKFFKLQRRDLEREYEQYALTPLSSLFADGKAHFGTVAGVTELGHLILHFETRSTPRLKVPMEFCAIRSKAYKEYGDSISSWSCNSLKFRTDDTHTMFSDILPIYYLKESKTMGCGRVSADLAGAIKAGLSQRKSIKFVMLETLPPTELLKNLAEYIMWHKDNEDLAIKPIFGYDDWKPQEISDAEDAPKRILSSLTENDVCVLQGSPGTGKSYALASIVSKYIVENKRVCVTTQSNASLLSLLSQETMKPAIAHGTIYKTVLTAEELNRHPFLKPAETTLSVPNGGLLCSTYYSLSKVINKADHPVYDLIVIEEASQAFLTAIVAFMGLGKKCLIVGDPMQLPPVVDISDPEEYKGIDVNTQANGMLTYVCSKNVPSYRLTTSFRLPPVSANLSKIFYGGNLSSAQKTRTTFNVPSEMRAFFPADGGTITYATSGSSGANCSNEALELIRKIVKVFSNNYPERRLAILTPFVLTTKTLQGEFCDTDQKLDLLVDTINRIQGETVDYTIYYVPLRNPGFAFSDNLFNVATSRSRSTTLLITDMPRNLIPISSTKVRKYLSQCPEVNFDN